MRRNRIYHFLLIVSIIFCFQANVKAAHIVGGDARYTFIEFDDDTSHVTFRIEFFMYRDAFSNGAPFDSPFNANGIGANFGIYRENLNGTWTFVDQRLNLDHGEILDVPFEDDPCVDEKADVGVESTSYTFDITLPIINTSYMITYQRCCRNNSISNIRDPGDTGAVFSIEITAEGQAVGNTSPSFNSFPPIFICADQDVDFDHSASDMDGDVLRYSFCAPLESGGPTGAGGGPQNCCDCVRPDPDICPPIYDEVNFLPPYTATAPLAGNPVVEIDPISGLISGVPETPDVQLVVGVCVRETRNGVLLSEMRRDFQFNVVPCVPNVFAQLEGEEVDAGGLDGKTFFIQSCGETEVEIENTSFDEDKIFDYHWTFFNPDGTLLAERQGGAGVRDVTIAFPGVGDYAGQMILNEGSECSDTANFEVNLYPSIEAGFTFEYDTCKAAEVFFTSDQLSFTGAAGGITEWEWDFGDGTFSALENPKHQYNEPGPKNVILTVTDGNECESTYSDMFDWSPVPQALIVEPSTFLGCSPANITFTNLSSPIDSTYDIFWEFGDGNMSGEISPTHIFEEPGTYDISLKVVSPLNCETKRDFNSWITVLEGPDAQFICTPDDPNIFQNTVQFSDQSIDAGAWQWDFGGIGNAFVQNPTYAFPDTGVYRVNLTVFHPITSCPDTISKLIDVTPVVRYFLPNAFTPNNDASNDLFLGKGYVDGLQDFNLNIWNRWGEKVFETNDPRDGWNGQKDNSGPLSPQGVYVYQLSFTGPRGEKERRDGHVTLLR